MGRPVLQRVANAVKRRLPPVRPLALRPYLTGSDYRMVARTPRFKHGSVRVGDRRIAYSDSLGLLHSVAEIFDDGVYRFDARTDHPHIVDAGANIGLSVLYFKRRFPAATIVAYEPDPTIFGMLAANVEGLPGIELRQAAAWIDDTTLTFFSEGSLAGSTELDFAHTGRTAQVRAERLRTELAKRPVDFLKIDIEGAENDVLFDIEDQLAQVDNLFFEYHSNPSKSQRLGDMLNLVTRNGFRYVINGAHGPRHPFVEHVTDGFDLQLNISCYRPLVNGDNMMNDLPIQENNLG